MVRDIHTFKNGQELILMEHGVPAPGSQAVPVHSEVQLIRIDGMYATVLWKGSSHYIKAWTKAKEAGSR